MQSGSSFVDRESNPEPEPIEIDTDYDTNNVLTSSAIPGSSFTHALNPLQMGQGASTPRDELSSHAASDGGDHRSDVDRERAATAARIRRTRRLRNHMEHFTWVRNRMSPSGTPSSSSSSSSGTRVPRLRIRAHSILLSRSRSPSPHPGGLSRNGDISMRRRTMPPISAPIPMSSSTFDADRHMMDISAVTPSASATPALSTPAGSTRRSRMSRVRDSISSWPSLMSSRPRTIDTPRHSVVETSSRTSEMDTDPPASLNTPASTTPPSSPPPDRADRPSPFGPGLLEGLQNPGRAQPGEDQAAMLSRLLSVAAAATAASLVGNAEEAITQAQDVGGDNGGDGSFDSFLRALQNGRLETALRNGGNEMGGGNAAGNSQGENGTLSLNYFRMFRFGSSASDNNNNNSGSSNNNNNNTNNDNGNHNAENGENGSNSDGNTQENGGRMVPVIIVGIRSVSPRESADGDGNARPTPFFDALANLPVPIPSINRRPRFGSSAHRRAASVGATAGAMPPNGSTASGRNDSTAGPNPVPASPTAPVLSFPNASFPRRRALEDSFEEEGLSGQRRDPSRRRLPRRLSNPDTTNPFGSSSGSTNSSEAGSRTSTSGRPAPASNPEGTRSWIIYVLGGSYPENHPILTTPSLFTDEPTYEDMTLLSSLLGPAKLPVAAKEDLESAGGLFTWGSENSPVDCITGNDERCLICLCEYEKENECRQLTKCKHVFHKECIDEWLTTGRNSCPLCRGEGVEEKTKAVEGSSSSSSSAAAAPSATPLVQ